MHVIICFLTSISRLNAETACDLEGMASTKGPMFIPIPPGLAQRTLAASASFQFSGRELVANVAG